MTIDQKFMSNAGKNVRSIELTDEDLADAITASSLVVAYLYALGPRFSLAVTPLRGYCDELLGFASARGWSESRIASLLR